MNHILEFELGRRGNVARVQQRLISNKRFAVVKCPIFIAVRPCSGSFVFRRYLAKKGRTTCGSGTGLLLGPRASRPLKREARTNRPLRTIHVKNGFIRIIKLDEWHFVVTVRASRFGGRDARGPR
jgi:hypothetical protein